MSQDDNNTQPIVLSYSEKGEGTPLVLIHGFPLSSAIWRAQLDGLSDSMRVITPDLRGHGSSPAPEGHYTVDLLARDVLATLDSLRVEKAVIVGHSMGGYVAEAIYRIAPERFLGFGLVGSHHLADTPEAKAKRMDTAGKVAEQGSEVVAGMPIFAKDTPENASYVVSTRQTMRLTPTSGIIGALHAMAGRPDSTDTLKAITVPSVVILGQEDELVKPDVSRKSAELLPNNKLVEIPGAGHMPMLERPEATSQALRELVERVQSA